MSKAERTREFIIERTAELFNIRGFAGTSLFDMTEATGLTKGSIYSNFKNKDEVALAVFDYNWKKLTKLIADEIELENDPLATLLVYPKVFDKILGDPVLHAGCPILNTAIESDDTHPQLRQRASVAMRAWQHSVSRVIRKGIATGTLRSKLDPAATAFALIAMVEGSIMIAKLSGRPLDRKRGRVSIEEFIKGLQP